MLSFDIQVIEAGAQAVDGVLPASDAIWEADDLRPDDSVSVTGRLSAAGPGRWYFTGQLTGTAVVACRRCLAETPADVSDSFSALFAEAGTEDVDEDDVYALSANGRTLDLRPAVRESWLLAVPAFRTCRPDCQGICPNCGADRNVVSCACRTETADSRWDALRALRDTSS